jgi:adenosylhomocysteine nucleosidase
MFLFVAADPMEFAGLQTHCRRVAPLRLPVVWARTAELNGNPIVMIANGAGAKQAAKAVDAARQATAVVSIGFCGALDPAFRIGDIFVPAFIRGIPVRTPQSAAQYASGDLVSLDHVAQTAAEKRKLRTAGASAVEMEAAGVLERARALSLPFFCVRSITDLAEESFANDFNAALREDGHFDTMQILRSAMLRPLSRFPELVRLRKRCAIAARKLGGFLADCRF